MPSFHPPPLQVHTGPRPHVYRTGALGGRGTGRGGRDELRTPPGKPSFLLTGQNRFPTPPHPPCYFQKLSFYSVEKKSKVPVNRLETTLM